MAASMAPQKIHQSSTSLVMSVSNKATSNLKAQQFRVKGYLDRNLIWDRFCHHSAPPSKINNKTPIYRVPRMLLIQNLKRDLEQRFLMPTSKLPTLPQLFSLFGLSFSLQSPWRDPNHLLGSQQNTSQPDWPLWCFPWELHWHLKILWMLLRNLHRSLCSFPCVMLWCHS